jgi:hypothetical protein
MEGWWVSPVSRFPVEVDDRGMQFATVAVIPLTPIVAEAISVDTELIVLLIVVGLVLLWAALAAFTVACVAAYRAGKGSIPALVVSIGLLTPMTLMVDSEPGMRIALLVPIGLFFWGRSKRGDVPPRPERAAAAQ